MKKTGALVFLVLVLAILPGVSAFADDAYQVKILPNDDPVYGTWINKEYDGTSAKQWQKWVLYSWGFGERYDKVTDPEGQPHARFTFIIVDKWTDSKGNSCYKVFYQERGGRDHFMYRVSKDRSTLEMIYRSAGFPSETDIHPGYPSYMKYRRQ